MAMKANYRFITQVSAEDLRQIAAVVNAVSGIGIVLDKRNDSVMVSIDEGQFKRMVYSFCRQAWPNACPASTAVPIDNIDLGANV